MAKKKINSDGIYFLGQASMDVTGSQYLVQFAGKKILLECGLHQSSSNSYLNSYRINSAKFQFKPKEIDYLFIAHAHVDHCGLVPRLVHNGFRGEIITTRNTALVMKALLLNCAFIVQEEARILSKRYKRSYEPIYTESDVYEALKLVKVYDEYDTIIDLDDIVSFQWFKNSHCVGAAQLQLILNSKSKKKKILYSSDIGSLHTSNHYLDNTEIPSVYNDIAIMESTYGSVKRQSNKTRDYDVKHLKTAIDTVIGRGGTLVLPCFSFNRTQELLTNIYLLFKDDKRFKADVIVDSKLSCDISDLYSKMLYGTDYELWEKVCEWENVKFVPDIEVSRHYVSNNDPKIVISSSGFCTNGRVINYLKKYLKDDKSMIVFSGYVGDNPSYLSYRIKNNGSRETISINKEKIPNRADCISLSTFSSHANHDELVEYGSSLMTNKLILVHGSEESKKCLAKDLKDAISRKDKTFKVSCANKGMFVRL